MPPAVADVPRMSVSDAATTQLIGAAVGQVGVTRIYDPAYVRLEFPGGDIPRERGVCTDVIIRAFRDGLDLDLQLAVNRDMRSSFAAYPQIWGLSRPDSNIDHRRVPNLARLLQRVGAEVTIGGGPDDFQPGDIVTTLLPGNLPHILIVSDRLAADGQTPLVVHNIGAGTRMENALFEYPITGHFRLTPPVLDRLRELSQP